MEMEVLIREFSETLISELALRDELEYEKEMKNTFISLLLAVQNKRRQYHVEKKRGKAQGKSPTAGKCHNVCCRWPKSSVDFLELQFDHFIRVPGTDPKYLTTVIPYHLENGTPDNQALQVLIKSKLSNSSIHCRAQIFKYKCRFSCSTQGHQ